MRIGLSALVLAGICAGFSSANPCGNELSPYGINAHAPQAPYLNSLLDAVTECGIDWIRIDFNWMWIETSQDQFNWSIYDAIVNAAAARGISIFATAGYTPAWATSGTQGPGIPNNSSDWYDFCYRAAQRYDGRHGLPAIEYWGMWNEPNLDGFWAGTRSQYINDILRNGADAVHAANPNARVCGPELAHLTSGDQDWYAWLEDAINQAGDKLDVVTHHVYCSSGYASCTDKLEDPPFLPWDPPSVKQVLQNTGWLGKPFWLTEIGWQSEDVGEQEQADSYSGILNNWFTGQSGRQWIHKVFFYELSDSQAFPDLSWGILDVEPTFRRKPAFTAYQGFIAAHLPPPVLPAQASSPGPAHQATNVAIDVDLSWDPAECAESYDVYFGTTSPGAFRGNQTGTTFDPGLLGYGQTLYWRIDSKNGDGTTTGAVWQFTTLTLGSLADFDRDNDVDQDDFGHFQSCLSGTGQPYDSGCADADLSNDGDGADLAIFLGCVSGAHVPPGC